MHCSGMIDMLQVSQFRKIKRNAIPKCCDFLSPSKNMSGPTLSHITLTPQSYNGSLVKFILVKCKPLSAKQTIRYLGSNIRQMSVIPWRPHEKNSQQKIGLQMQQSRTRKLYVCKLQYKISLTNLSEPREQNNIVSSGCSPPPIWTRQAVLR